MRHADGDTARSRDHRVARNGGATGTGRGRYSRRVSYVPGPAERLTQAGIRVRGEDEVSAPERELPQWANTFLLRVGGGCVRFAASVFARGGLRRSLRESGVEVQEKPSWQAPVPPGR